MESRLIYAKSSHLQGKLKWEKNGDTEWIYFGEGKESDIVKIENEIYSWFLADILYLACTRKDSFATTKADFIKDILHILGTENFLAWDDNFCRCIEFNKIGVFRKGMR